MRSNLRWWFLLLLVPLFCYAESEFISKLKDKLWSAYVDFFGGAFLGVAFLGL
jgi:hypothetical protein